MRTLRVLILLLVLSSCSSLNPLSALTGGTNVAANTQVGAENNQTVGTVSNTEFTLNRPQARTIKQSSDESQLKADKVENVTIENVPPWLIVLLIVGWLLPSPNEIGRSIRALFSRRDS